MVRVVDANCLVRYLLRDDPEKADAIEKLFFSPDSTLIILDVIIAEVVWLLTTFYKIPKLVVIEKLVALLSFPCFQFNRSIIQNAFSYWKKHAVDFVDAYLVSYSMEKNIAGIYSYDRDFDKIKTLKRLEP